MYIIKHKRCADCKNLDTLKLQLKKEGFCSKKKKICSRERNADICLSFEKRIENN
jgi:hypothetical protein